MNGTAVSLAQLPNRGHLWIVLRTFTISKKCLDPSAASDQIVLPHPTVLTRETLRKGQSPLLCTGLGHSCYAHYSCEAVPLV